MNKENNSHISPPYNFDINCIATKLILSNNYKEIIRELKLTIPFSEEIIKNITCKVIPGSEEITKYTLLKTNTPNFYTLYIQLKAELIITIFTSSKEYILQNSPLIGLFCNMYLTTENFSEIEAKITNIDCYKKDLESGFKHQKSLSGSEADEQFGYSLAHDEQDLFLTIGSPSKNYGSLIEVGKITGYDYINNITIFSSFGTGNYDCQGFSLSIDNLVSNENNILTGAVNGLNILSISSGLARVLSKIDGTILQQVDGYEGFSLFGWSVSWLGDITGDGIPDFAVGVPCATASGKNNAGIVYIYDGNTGTLLYTIEGENSEDHFGYTVQKIGDLDGDSFPDFAIGAPFSSPNSIYEAGIIYVYSGNTGTLLYTIEGEESNGGLGFSIAKIEDLNNDTIPDIISGAPDTSPNGNINAGSVYAFSGLDGTKLLEFNGTIADEECGISVSSIGDLDGDGFPDIAIGAPSASPDSKEFAGKVYLISSKTGNLLRILKGNTVWAQFGWSLCSNNNSNNNLLFIGSPDNNTVDIYKLNQSILNIDLKLQVNISILKEANILIPSFRSKLKHDICLFNI